MIPDFDEFGNLLYQEKDNGIYKSDLIEVKNVFVEEFSNSNIRMMVFSGYGQYLQNLKKLNLTCPQLLDGGFIGAKINPKDIDIVNMFDAVFFDNLSESGQAQADRLLAWQESSYQIENQKMFRTHTLPCPVYPNGHPQKERITDYCYNHWVNWLTRCKPPHNTRRKGILKVNSESIDDSLVNHGFFSFDGNSFSEGSPEEEPMTEQQFDQRTLSQLRENLGQANNMLKKTTLMIEETPDIPSLYLVFKSISNQVSELTQEYALAASGNPEAQALLVNLSREESLLTPITFLAKFIEHTQDAISQIHKIKSAFSIGKGFLGSPSLSWGGAYDGSLGLILLETPPKNKEQIPFKVPGELNSLGESLKEFTNLLNCKDDKDKLKAMADRLGSDAMVSYKKVIREIKDNQADAQFVHPNTQQSTLISNDLARKIFAAIEEREEKEIEMVKIVGDLKVINLLDHTVTIALPKSSVLTGSDKTRKKRSPDFVRFEGRFSGKEIEEKIKNMLDQVVEADFEIETTIEEGTGRPKQTKRLILIKAKGKQSSFFD